MDLLERSKMVSHNKTLSKSYKKINRSAMNMTCNEKFFAKVKWWSNLCVTKLKKFLQSILSFLILILYTLCVAGIYYAVEKNYCDLNNRVILINGSRTTSLLDNYWHALHFIATLETTIGYGDITPCTMWGQLLSILFSIIGIPLFLVYLTHFGKWLEVKLNKLYLWFKYITKKTNRVDEENLKTDPGVHTDFVPLSVGLGIALLWILICSIYFYFTLKPFYNDNFNFFTAIYFTLISFLTIGLGDISPIDYEMTICTYIFIIMGLALVTMCIDIVQDKLEIMFDNMKRLIEKESKAILAQGGKMADDPKAAEILFKKLLEKDPNAKWLSAFISEKAKNQIVATVQTMSKKVSSSVQTDNKKMIDQDTSTEVEEEKPTPIPEPSKKLIVRFTKKHLGYNDPKSIKVRDLLRTIKETE